MKQGNRSQGSRGASEGHAGNRSGKPSRRSGAQDSVSAARRSPGKQCKRNESGKQDSWHASREDKRLGEGPVAGAGRRDSEKAHGSGKPKSAHGLGKTQGSRGLGKAHASRSVSAAAPAAKQPKHQGSLPPRSAFLSVSRADMEERGWRCV